AGARLQHTIAVEIPLHLQAAGSNRQLDAMIGTGASVDCELIEGGGGGDDAMGVVYEGQLAAAKVAATIDSVVDVSERHIGARAADDIFCAIRQDHMPGTGERNALCNDLQIGLVAGGM